MMPVTFGSNVLRRLAPAAAFTAFAAMVMGSYVSKSGAGLACPDWPLCNGRLLPALDGPVLLEWAHRFLVSIVGVLTLALALVARRSQQVDRRSARLTLLALGLLMVQIALGGVTIYARLHPLAVTSHLAVALLFFGTLVWITASTRTVSA